MDFIPRLVSFSIIYIVNTIPFCSLFCCHLLKQYIEFEEKIAFSRIFTEFVTFYVFKQMYHTCRVMASNGMQWLDATRQKIPLVNSMQIFS